MPEKLQFENEIKSVLKRRISHDMARLKGLNTDSFETVETSKRSDEMWESGEIPMIVNTITWCQRATSQR